MSEGTAPTSKTQGISEFLVQVYGEQREALLDYAVARGHGVEVADFISPQLLDDADGRAKLVAWYRARLPEVRGTLGFHGAFHDLLPSALDPKVRAVARDRIGRCLDIAEELGAGGIVFHSDFNPVKRSPEYHGNWAARQRDFWQEMMRGRRIGLLIENVWEPTPDMFARWMAEIGLESAGVCFDAAHAHLWGNAPPAEWVKALAQSIRYLHLSDNDRTWDQHFTAGQGTVDWAAFLGALEAEGLTLPAVIEVDGVEGAEGTEQHLRRISEPRAKATSGGGE